MLNAIDKQLLELAIVEDLGEQITDATTDLLFDGSHEQHQVKIISKDNDPVVVSGVACVEPVLQRLGGRYTLDVKVNDGGVLNKGDVLLTISGDPLLLLKAERLLLNLLRHLSAVATLTSKIVAKTKGTACKVLDTRKTTPGMRHLEKYAVACGGGVNHRMGLYDAIMIKDTHVDLLGGMGNALSKLPLLKDNPLPVIVEVRSLEELQVVIDHGRDKVSRVLLDNIRGDDLRECVQRCESVFETEASGNLDLESIADVAACGVDFASVGLLTHSAGNVDLSMKSIDA